MSAAYLDAAVFVHALGRDDDLREACRSVLAMVRAETIVAQSSVLTVEEVVHVRSRRLGDRARAVREGRDVASMVALQEVGRADLDRALELFGDHPALDPRDAVHAAIAVRIGAPAIISTDADFDALGDAQRIDPRDARALAALAR
jgi:predicted nucleic acid-binding protein